jgi:Carboxypeptidase regulatory-like domain
LRRKHLLWVLALFYQCQGNAAAQVITVETVEGKTVACMHTGLTSTDCGVRANWYNYVFVGLISKVTPLDNGEKEIQIVPEEVFWGEPTTSMKAVTSQAACMRELKSGDKWLFYLRKGNPIVLDYYANDSVPFSHAEEEIATLRQLKEIGDFGILRGQVVRTDASGPQGVPNAQVVAIHQPKNEQFACVTGPDGRYEFERLPAGAYKVVVRPIGSYQPDDAEINLVGGTCTDLTLSRFPHARIAGNVTRSDGTPVPNLGVVLIRSDNSGYVTTQTDPSGKFMFDSQEPGRYVLGLNYPVRADWFDGAGAGARVKIPPASLFYPGVRDRSNARIIQLASDEKLDTIDFVVPSP